MKNHVRGTIIFSKEGINGTISGKKNNIQKVKRQLKSICKIKKFLNIHKLNLIHIIIKF